MYKHTHTECCKEQFNCKRYFGTMNKKYKIVSAQIKFPKQ